MALVKRCSVGMWLLCALAFVACDDSEDSAPALDGGAGGGEDADASAEMDSGQPDGGGPDSGEPDASEPRAANGVHIYASVSGEHEVAVIDEGSREIVEHIAVGE